jgi:hypothetical protein
MTLLHCLREYTHQWADTFAQKRSLARAVTVGFGLLCGLGKRTITRAIGFHGNTQKDWSADYRVFSRSPWKPNDVFTPILEQAINEHKLQRLAFSSDDTRVWRTGRHVPDTQYHRDPLGPPFHTNLRWGHRFLQTSLILPLYQQDGQSSSRTIPVRFEMAPVVKKPGKRATEEAQATYRQEKKKRNLSRQFVDSVQQLRQHLNDTGHADKWMDMVVDGSFCNRTVFSHDWAALSVGITARCRKNIVLCKQGRGRRFYAKTKFTPEQVRRRDDLAPWQSASIFHGGCYRDVRYKDLGPVYWQGGARKKPLSVFCSWHRSVIARPRMAAPTIANPPTS